MQPEPHCSSPSAVPLQQPQCSIPSAAAPLQQPQCSSPSAAAPMQQPQCSPYRSAAGSERARICPRRAPAALKAGRAPKPAPSAALAPPGPRNFQFSQGFPTFLGNSPWEHPSRARSGGSSPGPLPAFVLYFTPACNWLTSDIRVTTLFKNSFKEIFWCCSPRRENRILILLFQHPKTCCICLSFSKQLWLCQEKNQENPNHQK